jgi:hypothetical protein
VVALLISPPGLLLGAPKPRVELRPANAAYTLGPECCELATAAGLEPEPWQAEGLDIMLGVRDDGRWSAREYAEILGRQQGKSIGLGLPRCLFGLLVLREQLLIWSAHQYKTSLETFLQAREALYRLGEEAGPNLIAIDSGDETLLVKVNNTNGEEGFELSIAQDWVSRVVARWRFVARSVASGRGFTGNVNVIDEAFAYTALQRRALAPTKLAVRNPQTVYLSSPPLTGASGEVLYAVAARAARRAAGLGFRDWGLAMLLDELAKMPAGERAAFISDRSNWQAALPALNRGRVTEEAVQELLEEFEGDDLGFATEVLCLWPKQASTGSGWRVISQDVWRARGGAEVRAETGLAFALDASWPDASMGAIGLAGGAGGELLVQVIDHRPGTAWMVKRAVALHKRWPDAAWVLDLRGPAGHLRRPLEDAGITLVTPGPTEVAHSFGRFRAALLDDPATLRHYDYQLAEFDSDDPEAVERDIAKRERAEALSNAVRDAATRPLGDGQTWGRSKSEPGADLSPLTAVTLAVGEAVRRGRTPPPPPQSVPAEDAAYARSETADLAQIGF